MSHFSVLVLVESESDPRARATELLAPYDENNEWFRDGSRWDWWVVGGRWSGSLTGYDPTTDPDNVETCDLCFGTGTRPGGQEQFGDAWFEACNGCNGCEGKGKRVSWPTQWKEYDLDILPVSEMRTEFLPTAIVTPDGKWFEDARMGWFGAEIERTKTEDEWRREVPRLLEAHRDHVAVLVDCHV